MQMIKKQAQAVTETALVFTLLDNSERYPRKQNQENRQQDRGQETAGDDVDSNSKQKWYEHRGSQYSARQ